MEKNFPVSTSKEISLTAAKFSNFFTTFCTESMIYSQSFFRKIIDESFILKRRLPEVGNIPGDKGKGIVAISLERSANEQGFRQQIRKKCNNFPRGWHATRWVAPGRYPFFG
jgi:hypothetical protein